MKKHTMIVTPLNCGFGYEINTISTFSNQDYENTKTGRIVLYRNATESYFKLKSCDAQCYIEPAFAGLRQGDLLELECEVMSPNGSCQLGITLGQFDKDGNMNNFMFRHFININHTDFRKYSIKIPIEKELKVDSPAVFTNIRNNELGTEMIIKNVVLHVHTSNPEFTLKEDIIRIQTKEEMENAIKVGAKSQVIDYSKSFTSYLNGLLSISEDGILRCNASNKEGFLKGIAIDLGEKSDKNSVAVYLEYKVDDNDRLKIQYTTENDKGISYYLDVASSWTKKIVYLNPSIDGGCKHFYVEIGSGNTIPNVDYSVRNIIIRKGITQEIKQSTLDSYLGRNLLDSLSMDIPTAKRFLISKNKSHATDSGFAPSDGWCVENPGLEISTTMGQPTPNDCLKVSFNAIATIGKYPIAIAQIAGDTGAGYSVKAGRTRFTETYLYFFKPNGERCLPTEIPDNTYVSIIVLYV